MDSEVVIFCAYGVILQVYISPMHDEIIVFKLRMKGQVCFQYRNRVRPGE